MNKKTQVKKTQVKKEDLVLDGNTLYCAEVDGELTEVFSTAEQLKSELEEKMDYLGIDSSSNPDIKIFRHMNTEVTYTRTLTINGKVVS